MRHACEALPRDSVFLADLALRLDDRPRFFARGVLLRLQPQQPGVAPKKTRRIPPAGLAAAAGRGHQACAGSSDCDTAADELPNHLVSLGCGARPRRGLRRGGLLQLLAGQRYDKDLRRGSPREKTQVRPGPDVRGPLRDQQRGAGQDGQRNHRQVQSEAQAEALHVLHDLRDRGLAYVRAGGVGGLRFAAFDFGDRQGQCREFVGRLRERHPPGRSECERRSHDGERRRERPPAGRGGRVRPLARHDRRGSPGDASHGAVEEGHRPRGDAGEDDHAAGVPHRLKPADAARRRGRKTSAGCVYQGGEREDCGV
mmetsp:Transcript_94938/g.307010  ORF Transcript_94938/g.307010 Transcript_94938/m.307010 type:complete len:313 (-) Transcript_94938:1375-2313(-)